MRQLTLLFQDPQKRLAPFPWVITPNSTSLAHRWWQALREDLQLPHHIERRFSHLGFLGTERDLPFLEKQIMAHLKRLEVISAKALDNQLTGQELTNQAHLVFEELVGRTQKISETFKQATELQQQDIAQLNYLIHEAEAMRRSLEAHSKYQKYWPVYLNDFLLDDPIRARRPLKPEDYNQFSFPMEFGHVRLHYVQLGKTPFDAFIDQDQWVSTDNILGQQFYSSSFDIVMGPDSNQAHFEAHVRQPFFDWLRKKGLKIEEQAYYTDQNNQRHGLGYLSVASTNKEQFSSLGIAQIQEEVAKRSYLSGLILKDEQGELQQFYN